MAADHKIFVITLGESNVGKTSLLIRFSKNYFVVGPKNTIGVETYSKTIVLNYKKIKIQLWDTAGQERHKAIFKKYFRQADGVLLVYDITNHETFYELPNWLRDLREHNEEATVFIVGSKSDLKHPNKVSVSTVENYARDEGLDFFETSSKKNKNVDEVFNKLVLKVLERKRIAPFYKDISNGEMVEGTSNNTESDSSQQQTEISSQPVIPPVDSTSVTNDVHTVTEDIPTITLSDDSGTKTKKKKKSCC